MILVPEAKDKTYAVLGLGKSGRASVASLLASGAKVVAWDDKDTTRDSVKAEFPTVEIQSFEQWNYVELAALVLSPGIFLTHKAVETCKRHHVEVMGDVELLYRAQPKARYVAITGTNGKSTTTTLIAHILNACGKKVEVGGNLGTPALALAPLDAQGIYVLELSSYQLDLIHTTRFQTAILLNISPDHLDHHGSMEKYIEAKEHIFDRQHREDVAIVGVDDATSEAVFRKLHALKEQKLLPISVTQHVVHGVDVRHGTLYNTMGDVLQGSLLGITSLQGEHNWQNAAAAYAACISEGCKHEDILAAMKTYPGLAHRMEWLGIVKGVQFVNDSKATNADATEKALKTYDHIHWILGGVAKEGGIEPLAQYFPKIRHAYLIGEAASDFAKTLEGHVAFTQCGTLEKAFAAAANAAKVNEAVVLSPACASFDQYPNFEVRGAAFVKLFNAWREAHGAAA